ncbi:hypothetical protein RHGRI_009483 [Rhododendron griersonianum]|uniref:SUI1 domain-containing protein n=1 Tax=Rhododendron griersonianum TaxID=479676 RepID=A0AAV6KEX2_9ERIC|nr:hypothetical protein RHGRI_009483 [Rhododendron griersonianum]
MACVRNIYLSNKYMVELDVQIPTTFDPFAEANDDSAASGTKGYVHIRIQQRNGRKSLTTVQGLKKEFSYEKILKDLKKEFCCNGTVVLDKELGKVIQLQGDQRKNVSNFLVQIKFGWDCEEGSDKVAWFLKHWAVVDYTSFSDSVKSCWCGFSLCVWFLNLLVFSSKMGGFGIGFLFTSMKKAILLFLAWSLVLGGAAVGTIPGALKGQTTETGLLRGAEIGAVAGAIAAVQLMELMVHGEPFSKVICSVLFASLLTN